MNLENPPSKTQDQDIGERIGEVSQLLSNIDKQFTVLGDRLFELRDVLDPVMVQARPMSDKDSPDEQQPETVLGESLFAYKNYLTQAIENLEDLIHRTKLGL